MTTPLPWALHSDTRLARIVRANYAGRGGAIAQFVLEADANLACQSVNAVPLLVAAVRELLSLPGIKSETQARAEDAIWAAQQK